MNYSPVILQTGDYEVVQGWFMSEYDPRHLSLLAEMRLDRRLVVFFHENAGNLGLRMDYFQTLYHEANCDVLAVAYRGYSSSSGKPTEEGLKLDAAAVINFLNKDLAQFYANRGGVFILGRSLGGAVAAATVASLDDK